MAPHPAIAILAPAANRQADDLAAAANALQVDCALRLGISDTARVSMGDDIVSRDGHELTALDSVFVHGFRYMDPVVPRAREDVDWSVWHASYIVEQQQFSTFYSVLCELVRRGVEVINPPAAGILDFTKGAALERLRRAGVRVPPILCSNEDERVRAFCELPGKTVWRPSTGRAAWQLFLDKQREHLVVLDKPPIMLAKVVEGPVLQCWVFKGEPLLSLCYDPPDSSGLEYLEGFWSVVPPDAVHATARSACEALGASWIKLSCVTEGEAALVYDVDVDPLLDWMPPSYRSYLIAQLAARLLKLERAALELPDTYEGRPTLFLRRMLRELFDYEASKYR